MKQEHRVLERLLDELLAALGSGAGFEDSFRRTGRAAAAHYRREEPFLRMLGGHEPALGAKIAAQHAEASEIAARWEESAAAGHAADTRSLARRFCAIAQHNIIEEERDVFPLADRCFTGEEWRELERAHAKEG